MDIQIKESFIEKWQKYFGAAELPITFRYTDGLNGDEQDPTYAEDGHCVIGALNAVRKGKTVVFNKDTIRCGGGMRYLGYVEDFDAYLAHIEKFLSKTEHYKESPELARAYFERSVPRFKAPAKHCVFTPWSKLAEGNTPDVVVFFATPDVISGLYNLANFDRTDANGVICPWGSGCASIVMSPYRELENDDQHAVLGMFDPSARPCIGASELCFSIPFPRFLEMYERMDDTFLTTKAWEKIRARVD